MNEGLKFPCKSAFLIHVNHLFYFSLYPHILRFQHAFIHFFYGGLSMCVFQADLISLSLSQASFPGNLHLVLVLRPTSFFQRTVTDLGFRFSQEDFMLKMPVWLITTSIRCNLCELQHHPPHVFLLLRWWCSALSQICCATLMRTSWPQSLEELSTTATATGSSWEQ